MTLSVVAIVLGIGVMLVMPLVRGILVDRRRSAEGARPATRQSASDVSDSGSSWSSGNDGFLLGTVAVASQDHERSNDHASDAHESGWGEHGASGSWGEAGESAESGDSGGDSGDSGGESSSSD